jgi:hypothetical protein
VDKNMGELLNEISEPNRTIIIGAAKRLGAKPIELINYLIAKDIEAIIMAQYSRKIKPSKIKLLKIKDLDTTLESKKEKSVVGVDSFLDEPSDK